MGSALWDMVVKECEAQFLREVREHGGSVIAAHGVIGFVGSLVPGSCLVYEASADLRSLLTDPLITEVPSLQVIATHPELDSIPNTQFVLEEFVTQMVLSGPSSLLHIEDPKSVTIVPVAIPDDLDRFYTAMANGFEDEPSTARRYLPADMLIALRPHLFLAEQNGEAIGTAGARIRVRGGTLFGISVDPSARHRGIGAALTISAAMSLFDSGADFVTLQASAAGHRVYERVGFEVAGSLAAFTQP